uniref:Odorant receptor n=1 Tax=Bombyx mori TaxID=7091 RepID=A0A8R2QVD3_BOMMO|nr:olfactory receptor 45 isoform X2 [Bombyx mori]
MKVLDNVNHAVKVTMNCCRLYGLFVSDDLTKRQLIIMRAFSLMLYLFFVGFFITTQSALIITMWGDLNLMTNVGLVLGTHLTLSAKVFTLHYKEKEITNVIYKNEVRLRAETREQGKYIISEMNRETTLFMRLFIPFGMGTVTAWLLCTPKGELYTPAWYPCNTTKSPAHEIILAHQGIAVILTATLEIAIVLLMTSIVAVCRCRLKLVGLSFETICDDLPSNIMNKLTADEQVIVAKRVRENVIEHQAVLECINDIQDCFSSAMLVHIAISTMIICATAYQLAVSMEVATAVYSCPWYTFPTSLKRSLLVIMIRAQQPALLTAGGFAPLLLDTFVSIMKASYSFFTVLQNASE